MNLLLDTHVVLWSFTNDPTMSDPARALIQDGRNLVFVSAVTAWEIAIKKTLGKLQAPGDFEEELVRHRFTPLDITCAHALAVEDLPPIHRDPFDRLLVAQARLEALTILTRDANIASYGVRVITA